MIESQEHGSVEVGSNRSFGIVFFAVFLVIGLFPLISGSGVRLWSLVIAGIFLAAALVYPKILEPLNKLWFRFGMLLAKIVNPIVMFIIYVTTVLPIGLLLRALGKDLLSKKLDKNMPSYWKERSPPGPEPDSLTDQF
jgi:nitrate reductase NapE component